MRTYLLAALIGLLSVCGSTSALSRVRSDLVKTAADAEKIARAAFQVRFGDDEYRSNIEGRDFKIEERKGVWTVMGYQHGCVDGSSYDPKTQLTSITMCYFGAPTADIAAKDGAVKRIEYAH